MESNGKGGGKVEYDGDESSSNYDSSEGEGNEGAGEEDLGEEEFGDTGSEDGICDNCFDLRTEDNGDGIGVMTPLSKCKSCTAYTEVKVWQKENNDVFLNTEALQLLVDLGVLRSVDEWILTDIYCEVEDYLVYRTEFQRYTPGYTVGPEKTLRYIVPMKEALLKNKGGHFQGLVTTNQLLKKELGPKPYEY